MPSDASTALRDVAYHIDLATQLVTGFDADTFNSDVRTVYAVTRCVEIISEASRRLPSELKPRHPSIAWKDMAGVGTLSAQHVWDAVQIDLPPLRAVIERELAGLN